MQRDVLNLIARENLQPGDRLPAERDLARHFSASVITIQRALADLVRQDLIERIQGKGTFVKRRPLDETMVHSLGFVLVNRTSFYYERLLEESRNAARRRNHNLVVINAGERPDDAVTRELSTLTGVLLSGIVTDEWIEVLEMMRLPCAVVGAHHLARRVNQARFDMEAAARLLTGTFLGRAFRRIGLINGARTYLPSQEIFEGYRQSLADAGLPYDDTRTVWCRKERRFEDLSDFFARQEQGLDALVVESGCFWPLHLFLYERDMSLPRTMLGTILDQPIPEGPLRKVQQVVFENTLGERAVNLLFQAMTGNGEARIELIQPRLVAAGSSA